MTRPEGIHQDCDGTNTDPDRDNDNIDNGPDDCPDRAETRNGYEPDGGSPDGCPDTEPTSTEIAERTISFPESEVITLNVDAWASSGAGDSTAKLVIEGENGLTTTLLSVSGNSGYEQVDADDFDLSSYSGQDVTVKVVALNESEVAVNEWKITIDSDGDGLSNSVENGGIRRGNGDVIFTDPFDADTDGDTLKDGREVGVRTSSTSSGDGGTPQPGIQSGPDQDSGSNGPATTFFKINSDPSEIDSDEDGLRDPKEVRGWEYSVFRKNGDPWRHDPYGESSDANLSVTSDPLEAHSDDDGINDYFEKNVFHTDPTQTVTYGVTEMHQERVIETLYEDWQDSEDPSQVASSASRIGILSKKESMSDLKDKQLTDRTDDSDFVLPEDPVYDGVGSLTFIALDKTRRTDTWYSNQEEAVSGSVMWDPDTDDDGLTDGQEFGWITRASRDGSSVSVDMQVDTNPTNPDTDGDGYWDGWMGVYGVGATDNVVLYMEHLYDDDDGDGLVVRHPGIQVADGSVVINEDDGGIRGDEIVSEQTGVHKVSSDDPGAYIYDNGTKYHANLHIGEMQWRESSFSMEGNPTDTSVTPDTSLLIEVDYMSDHNPYKIKKNGKSVIEETEENLRLYGIKASFLESDELTDRKLKYTKLLGNYVPGKQPRWITPDTVSAAEMAAIEAKFHDRPEALHLLFASSYKAEKPYFFSHDFVLSQQSVNPLGMEGHTGSPAQVAIMDELERFRGEMTGVPHGTAVFESEIDKNYGFDRTQDVLMEELGHGVGAGWLDDKAAAIGECYSGSYAGSGCYLTEKIGKNTDQFKTVLATGNVSKIRLEATSTSDRTPEYITPRGSNDGVWSIMSLEPRRQPGQYYVFSIEEASTVDLANLPEREDDDD